MQLTAPCSVQLLLHCHPDAPPDPSWLQAVSSQMPTAGHFSALEAPQLALDTQRLLTTPIQVRSDTGYFATPTLPSQSEPQSSCPKLWAQALSPSVSSQHSSPGCSD